MMTRLSETESLRVSARRHAFTLLELLVVIGIISVLSVATVISVQKISRDVKLSTGVNRVLGALTSARSEAIRTNTPTLATFRIVKDFDDPSKPGQVEIVIAQFTGDIKGASSYGSTSDAYFERYQPVPTIAPRLLPEGIKVAAPFTEFSLPDQEDTLWNFMASDPMELTQITFNGDSAPTTTYDTREGQWGGGFAVLFNGDGTMIMRDPDTMISAEKSSYRFVDFDGDRQFDVSKGTGGYGGNSLFFEQRQTDRDFLVNSAQFLVVYDEERARQDVDFTNWGASSGVVNFIEDRNAELGPWVTQNADRIHFNRYTGLAEVGAR
jgi:prepilin-type N-terminal cleavage/methylation domain-containing protein